MQRKDGMAVHDRLRLKEVGSWEGLDVQMTLGFRRSNKMHSVSQSRTSTPTAILYQGPTCTGRP